MDMSSDTPETPAIPESPAAIEASDPIDAKAAAANDAIPELDSTELEMSIVEQLKTIFDPEIPVNIYELGLIYDIDIQGTDVKVKMTLTSPGCPVAGSLPGEVQAKVESVPGVTSADIELVWEPTWNPSLMTEAARLQLGMF